MSHNPGLPGVGTQAYSAHRLSYEYDREARLDARVLDRVEDEACTREKITLRGSAMRLVPGYMLVPKHATPPYPCILAAHGMGGSKDRWLEPGPDRANTTQALLLAGFAVLILDAPYHGERTYEIDFESIFTRIRPNLYRELIIQWTIEYRLAMDYLANRPEVDRSRIGILGYSLGGVMAYNLAGVDPRIKVAVIAATAPLSQHYIHLIGWDDIALARMLPIAPQTFAPIIQSPPFLMLNGRDDEYSTLEGIQELYELIGSPVKELVLFDSGHILPPDHLPRVVDWFSRYLSQAREAGA